MRKTIYVTLGLFIVAALLGLYVIVYDKGGGEEDMSKGEWSPRPLIKDRDAIIEKLVLIREEGRIELKQVATDLWLITEPVEYPAHQISASVLVSDIARMKNERIIELEAEDLSRYGLDKPRLELIVHFAKKEEPLHLLVGKASFTRQHVFAKLKSEDTVFLISRVLENSFHIPLERLRSSSLIDFSPQQVVSIDIEINGPGLEEQYPYALEPRLVVQKQAGKEPQWVIVDPVHENASFKAVNSFFHALKFTEVISIIDVEEGEITKYGLDEPRARISVKLTDGSEKNIIFGAGDEGTIFAKNEDMPSVLAIRERTFSKVIEPGFRKKQVVTGAVIKSLTRMELAFPKSPGKNISLVQEEENDVFHFRQDPKTKVLPKALSWILRPLRQNGIEFLEQQKPLPAEKYGLDTPRMRITAYEKDVPILDVSVGDTTRSQGAINTYLLDHLRECIVKSPVDIMDQIPREKEHLAATEEELQRHERRRARRR